MAIFCEVKLFLNIVENSVTQGNMGHKQLLLLSHCFQKSSAAYTPKCILQVVIQRVKRKFTSRERVNDACIFCFSVSMHSSRVVDLAMSKIPKPAKVVCELCDREFAHRHNLRTHMRLHSGDLPFECSVCHRRFNSHWNLRRHTLNKHTSY